MFSQFSATLSNVVHLKLGAYDARDRELEGWDDGKWLYLLHQFSTVQSLYVSRPLARHVALALEDITAEVAEVLPSLDLICLEDYLSVEVPEFVAARRLSDRPVAVVVSSYEFDERLESYASK
jgi:hypothetical protein